VITGPGTGCSGARPYHAADDLVHLLTASQPPPPRKKPGTPPSFAGFLYERRFGDVVRRSSKANGSTGFARDVFNAWFWCGSLFLLWSLIRRLRSPNPLVDLPYLRLWNTQVLSVALILFRFSLLSTIILVPQTLAIHGFEADQIGPGVVWTAAPQLLIALVAALLLLKGFDSRLLMATGFACMAFACCLNADLTSAWAAANFYRTELLMGVGQSFAFVGLVATIVLQAIASGGLSTPQRALTFSAFFHVTRLFGGEMGAAFMGHFIAVREELHSNLLGLHVQRGTWITDSSVGQLTAGLYSKSFGVSEAVGRAADVVGGRVRLQAYTLTFIDGFYLVAWACVVALVLAVFLRKVPLSYRDFEIGR
jgi:DHA2 family multidrug resistance protein